MKLLLRLGCRGVSGRFLGTSQLGPSPWKRLLEKGSINGPRGSYIGLLLRDFFNYFNKETTLFTIYSYYGNLTEVP